MVAQSGMVNPAMPSVTPFFKVCFRVTGMVAADDDERYHKAQKLAEDAVEGEKRSDGRFIEEIAEDYTQQDGNDDSCQEWHFDSFHIRKIAFCLQRYDISNLFPSILLFF